MKNNLFRKTIVNHPPNKENRIQKFLIIAVPRSGSTLLVASLNSHPEIVCHYELFHPKNVYLSLPHTGDEFISKWTPEIRDYMPFTFIKSVWNYQYPKCPKAIGFKIFKKHNPLVLDYLILNSLVKKIILKRDNLLMSYISRLEAEILDLWHVNRGDKLPAEEISNVKVKVNIEDFFNYTQRVNTFYNRVEERLKSNHQVYITLNYESYLEPDERIRILKFINVKANPGLIKVALKKLDKRPLWDRIENFDEVYIALKESPMKPFLFPKIVEFT